MGTVRNLWSLWRSGRKLAAHDALIPSEVLDNAPPLMRLGRFVMGFGAAKDDAGTPGDRLGRALAELGPGFIKMGQFLATRPDLVGAELAADLAHLQDRLPSFPQAEAERAVAEALGQPITEIFAKFGPAVAAASIAQVHYATLKDGRAVAVKVLRPNIEQVFADELAAMAFAARMAERMVPELRRLRPVAAVAELTKSVERELDLTAEAAAASAISDQFTEDANYGVPAVHWALTAKRVMTTDWVDGVPLHDLKAIDELGLDRKQLAANYADAFLRQALHHGLFHADPHPGNMFVNKDGKLIAVDFGIVGRLVRENRRYLAEILYGALERDYDRVAALHFEAGLVPAHHDRHDFSLAIRAIGEPVFGQAAQDMSMARIIGGLYDVTERFDMAAQPELMFLQKTMVVVEGVARMLDPEFSLWETGRPAIESFMRAELGPEAKFAEAVEGIAALAKAVSSGAFVVPGVTTAPGIVTGDASEWREARSSGFGLAAALTILVGGGALAVWLLGG